MTLHDTAQAATARPWSLRSGGHEVESAAGTVVVCGNYNEYGCGPIADAALIVLAVNNIEALADALRALVAASGEYPSIIAYPDAHKAALEQARAALRTLDGGDASAAAGEGGCAYCHHAHHRDNQCRTVDCHCAGEQP